MGKEKAPRISPRGLKWAVKCFFYFEVTPLKTD
jgi:hypothetical protein